MIEQREGNKGRRWRNRSIDGGIPASSSASTPTSPSTASSSSSPPSSPSPSYSASPSAAPTSATPTFVSTPEISIESLECLEKAFLEMNRPRADVRPHRFVDVMRSLCRARRLHMNEHIIELEAMLTSDRASPPCGSKRNMGGRVDEDVKVGANKFAERQTIGTSAHSFKDYVEPPAAPLFEPGELCSWSFYRAGIAEFVATFLFLYITVLTIMGVKSSAPCASVGLQGIAWAVGGTIFVLVYCTAGISGGHINPAVTFGLLLARKLSVPRAAFYMVMQCLGATCGAGMVKGLQTTQFQMLGGGVNVVQGGFTKSAGLGAEIIGTIILLSPSIRFSAA